MRNLFSLIYFFIIFFIIGCSSSKKFTTAPQIIFSPSSNLTFGVSEVDITPPPGFPMGGFGSSGKISRGVWTPLNAKANYIRDKDGNAFVIVSCDLWSVPMGLSLRVGEILGLSPSMDHHLGTSQILLSATHTHHSHAAFHPVEAYSILASPEAGFDNELFEWMAKKIASSIISAIDNRQPVIAAKWKHSIEGLIRNRSYEAFDNVSSQDSLEICSHVSHADQYFPSPGLPAFVKQKEEFSAVDPYVTTLIFYPLGATVASPIALINFCSLHPTVMGTFNELYSSDVFAIAGHRIKEVMGWWNTSISFINGSEGDISCNWYRQDRFNTDRLGVAIGDSILSPSRISTPIAGNISIGFDIIPISDREVNIPLNGNYPSCFNSLPQKTAKDPFPGLGTVGGAEDGRTELYYKGVKEGMTGSTCDPGHGNKEIAIKESVKHMFAALPPMLFPVIEYAFKKTIKGSAPREIPLGIHTIGDLGIVSLPGEITTTLGYHIKKKVASALGYSNYQNVLISGLTNEYLSYFTTPAEYAEQHYEGASTMYGFLSGSFLEQEIERIANNNSVNYNIEYKFKPGKDLKLNPNLIFKKVRWTVEDGLTPYLVDSNNGTVFNHFPVFIYEDAYYNFALDQQLSVRYYPSVEIQSWNQPSGSWTTFTYDSLETSIIKFVKGINNSHVQWGIMWMPDSNINSLDKFRFKVATPSGQEIYSDGFDVDEILNRGSSNVIKMHP